MPAQHLLDGMDFASSKIFLKNISLWLYFGFPPSMLPMTSWMLFSSPEFDPEIHICVQMIDSGRFPRETGRVWGKQNRKEVKAHSLAMSSKINRNLSLQGSSVGWAVCHRCSRSRKGVKTYPSSVSIVSEVFIPFLEQVESNSH